MQPNPRFWPLLLLGLVTSSVAASCYRGPQDSSQEHPEDTWGPCVSDDDCADDEFCNIVNMCTAREDSSPFECEGDCGAASAAPFGEVTASYRGVPAYSNGSTYGCHPCAEGQPLGLDCGFRCGQAAGEIAQTLYGPAYQCVEYVRRFYAEVYGDYTVAYSTGNANTYTGSQVANLGLTEHLNGNTTTLPRPDDILVFFGGNYGHIAIVTKVDEEAHRVWFIQQNVPSAAEMSATYQINGGQISLSSPLSGHPIQSWLRNPQYALPCREGLPCPEGYTCSGGTCQEAECPAPSESNGVMATPANGSSQTGPFIVAGSVSDDNGIERVTVAVDALETCKFSASPPDPAVLNYSFGIEVDPASCSLSPGTHTLGLWMQDGCGIASLVDDITFDYVVDSPPPMPMDDCVVGTVCCEASGSFTPAGSNGPQCLGECNSCSGAGSCEPEPSGTSCGGGQGTCSGAGACDVPTCGDGNQTIDPGEQCDGNALGGQSCTSLGFDGGSLSCTQACTFDTSGCTIDPPCAAANYWSPTSDSQTDFTGLQSTQSINVAIQVEVRQTGSGLEVQVCKPGDVFQEDVAFHIDDNASGSAFAQIASLATAGSQCSQWVGLSNDTGYLEGETFNGVWQLVSPSWVAGDWNWPANSCVVNGDPWGTCWSGSSVTLNRTCKGL